ncbi:MAG: autotransporter-associated beta strand repeat-containing protein [Limisphaera sp.]|nr:autotransporter-associated beta strand repeat-containing protein [Limisphaera sp.]
MSAQTPIRRWLFPQGMLRYTSFLLMLGAGLAARAQTAYWTGGAGNGFWHDPGNWDLDGLGVPTLPGPGTNVVIGAGAVVTYLEPTAAMPVGPLTLAGQLWVSAPGLVVDGAGLAGLTLEPGGSLQVTAAGVLVVTNGGTLAFSTDSSLSLDGGAVFLTNHPSGTAVLNIGVNGNNNGAGVTNRGGHLVTEIPVLLRGRFSRFLHQGGRLELRAGGGIYEGSNDQERPWLIDGGEVFLGDFSISRTTPVGGLLISNGNVVATSLRVGTHNSRAYATIYGGALTNTGLFTIGDRTNGATSGDRRIRFQVRGGTVVSTGPDGIVVGNQSNTGVAGDSVIGATLEISGGQVLAEKLTLIRDATLQNAHATLALSNPGALYLGSGGLQAHVGVANTSYRVYLAGGLLGALADYEIGADATLAGGATTFHTADPVGQPRSITIGGTLGGSGGLLKTGSGVLVLNGPAPYTGRTFVREGRLRIGHPEALQNTPALELSEGAVLDVTPVPGFTWAGTRTLSGLGRVEGGLTLQNGGILAPGLTNRGGPLVVNGSLTLGEGAICELVLARDPNAPDGDRVEVEGDLIVAGAVTLVLSGGGPAGSVHPLIRYTGTLAGDLSAIRLSGLTGVLSNNTTTARGLYLVITQAVRAPTSLVWVGNAQANVWDTLGRTNWLNLALQSLDSFVPGDRVLFDDRGTGQGPVQIPEPVQPGEVRVDSVGDYRFTGPGGMGGAMALLKTNHGTLVVETTNTYTGITWLAGGVLETPILTPGGMPSGVGAATADPLHLQFAGGTLRYTGPSVTVDRGAWLHEPGGTIAVASESTTLTWQGLLTGPGGLTKAGQGTLTLSSPNTYVGPTLLREGTLRLQVPGAAGTNRIELAGGTLALTLPSDNDLLNPLHVAARSRLVMGSANNRINGPVTGSNTLDVSIAAGTVLTFNGDLTNFTATFALGDSAGTFRFNSGGGNTTLGCPNATVDLGQGSATLQARNAGTMYVGALRGGPSTQVLGQGSGSGTLTWTIGSKETETFTTFEGTIADAAASRLAALTKVGPGTLRLTGASTYTGPTRIEAGVLQVDGSLGSTPVTVAGGTLSGTGTLNGPVDIQSGGTLAPGAGLGTLTVAHTLTLGPGSVTAVEVDAATGACDLVTGLWAVTYGGTLRVIKVAGAFAPGQRWKLFDAPGTYYGAFDAVEPAAPGPGLAWDLSQLTVDGTVGVVSVGEMPRLEFVRIPGALQLYWTGTYRLQVQTNALNVGLGTEWMDYPGAPASGVIIPLDPTAPSVFFRLVAP